MSIGGTQRRLAAILAADVVGYSKLMGQDEAGTLAALRTLRNGLVDPRIAEHGGRIFKSTGDGVLAEFPSVVNAVSCATVIQQEMRENPPNHAIQLRIGIDVGDVVVEDGDVFGDGVNVAARVESIAPPGGVALTETARDHLGSRLKLAFTDTGTHSLKNIERPMRVFVTGGVEKNTRTADTRVTDKPSLAVLPFTNMSGDPEQQYFSDGITEDIITELSRFRDLLVIARNSSFQFRDKAVDVKRVGRELGVQFVVEGSVRKLGSRVRITTQLIDARTGNHIWAERYDRELADVFALQDELAHAIAATVGGRVEATRKERVTHLSPEGLTAYDLALRAKALMFKYTKNDVHQARVFALRAIEIDPSNARAHAYYANIAFNLRMAYWTAERDNMFEEACRHAERAVALDGSDSVTRCILGFVKVFMRDYEDARRHLEKALASNPNETEARLYYAVYLTATGQPDAALEQLDLAQRLNPFDFVWTPWIKGIALFTAHRYGDAIAVLTQIPEPINEVRGWLAASYAHAGRLEEAKACLAHFLRVARQDMVVYPGDRLKDWEPYWHGALEYRDQRDFDHLFEALHKAGLADDCRFPLAGP